jgi:hypothetical protein
MIEPPGEVTRVIIDLDNDFQGKEMAEDLSNYLDWEFRQCAGRSALCLNQPFDLLWRLFSATHIDHLLGASSWRWQLSRRPSYPYASPERLLLGYF